MNAPLTASAKLSESSLDMIRRLVAFDTTSRRSNLELIDWVAAYIRSHGVEPRLTYDDDGKKANLFATIGPEIDGGIVLSGHTDVVPVDGQSWTSDPWQVSASGDRLVGRGVCDMKGFIGIALALVPEMITRKLSKPLHFALSYDEEVGCIGVRRLIEDLARIPYKPGGCIVGEPTGMQLVVAHKGKRSYRCRVRGFEAHSALTPNGVNAVEIACEIVTYLRAMALRFRHDERHDDDYDVPFTTIHVGTIRGGTALNIIPRDCEFMFEFRHLPFDDPEALLAEVRAFADRFLPEMRAVAADAGITFEQLSDLPGFDTGYQSAIADLARRARTLAEELPIDRRPGGDRLTTLVALAGRLREHVDVLQPVIDDAESAVAAASVKVDRAFEDAEAAGTGSDGPRPEDFSDGLKGLLEAHGDHLIVLDDPFGSIDHALRPTLLELLLSHEGQGPLVLLTEDPEILGWAIGLAAEQGAVASADSVLNLSPRNADTKASNPTPKPPARLPAGRR